MMSLLRFEQGPVECVMEEDLCNTTQIGSSYDLFVSVPRLISKQFFEKLLMIFINFLELFNLK